MIYTRPFKKEDFNAFEPIESLTETSSPEFVQAIEDSGLAVTGIRDGKIIGCGGVHPTDDDQGEMWLRLSKDCLKHKLDTLRWLKDGMKIIEETYPFEQLNAIVQCCFEQSIKLIEYLGFKRVQEVENWVVYSKRICE